MLKKLEEKILRRKAKIGIIGLGYVGLPLAITFIKAGFKVYGLDVDQDRVLKLGKGMSYILDTPSSEIKEAIASRNFAVTNDFHHIKDVDAVIICVPTPLYKTKEPDVSYIVSAVKNIKKHMKRGQIIVLESTTYPGTTEEVMLPVLEEGGMKEGKDFYLAFSPERIDPGNPNYDTKNTPKIIGGISKRSTDIAKLLYEQAIDTVIAVSSAKVAEMVKLLENTFRIVNIGMVNEIMLMCDRLGINVWEVIDAAKTKPYGYMPFYPGPGVGGHCLGKDEQIFVKDKDKNELKVIKISDFIKESKDDPESRTHDLRGITFIKPNAKEVFSYDVVNSEPCFKEVGILSERPYKGEMVTIELADNRKLSVTTKHPMIVFKAGVLGIKFADELSVGDEIPFFENIPPMDKTSPQKYKLEGDAKATPRHCEEREARRGNLKKRDCFGPSGLAMTALQQSQLSRAQIKNITCLAGKNDKVYSMEVRDTNTFVTSYGVLTHNCIPVDPIYLSWKARMHGFEARFIDLASQVNSEMPHYVVSKVIEGLNEHRKSLRCSTVLVVGVTYKKDVKDLRESPALEIIDMLIKRGALVSYYDPYLPYLKIERINLKCLPFDKNSFKDSDCVVIVTDHSNVDYKFIADNSKLVVDTRNVMKSIKSKSNIVRI